MREMGRKKFWQATKISIKVKRSVEILLFNRISSRNEKKDVNDRHEYYIDNLSRKRRDLSV